MEWIHLVTHKSEFRSSKCPPYTHNQCQWRPQEQRMPLYRNSFEPYGFVRCSLALRIRSLLIWCGRFDQVKCFLVSSLYRWCFSHAVTGLQPGLQQGKILNLLESDWVAPWSAWEVHRQANTLREGTSSAHLTSTQRNWRRSHRSLASLSVVQWRQYPLRYSFHSLHAGYAYHLQFALFVSVSERKVHLSVYALRVLQFQNFPYPNYLASQSQQVRTIFNSSLLSTLDSYCS